MIKLEVKTRIPHNKEVHYRILTNKAFYDKRLTPLAKILLMHLLGKHSEDYTPTLKQLVSVLHSTTDKINRAIACLKKYGYLTSTSIGGKKHGVQSWWIFELPDYLKEELTNGNNANGYNPTNGNNANGYNPTISKTDNLTISNNAILYKDIDCGGEKATPQSTNEEKEDITDTGGSQEDFDEYANVEF